MKTYIARQPIFQRDMCVYGYELLYRDSEKNSFNPNIDGDRATKSLVSNAITNFGLLKLCNKKYAFINFTENLLTSNLPSLLGSRDIIIEILEDVTPSTKIIQSIQKLKEHGYMFALDDYALDAKFDPLLELSDIIKVEYPKLTPKERKELPKDARFRDKKLLAEKIETQKEYLEAKRAGYDLFQGYYFSKPVAFSKESMQISPCSYTRALIELQKPSFNYKNMEKIISTDYTLTYKLLYRVNTLSYYRGHKIKSVRQALVRMGMSELYHWLLLVLMEDIAPESCNELVKTALIRAICAEQLAKLLKDKINLSCDGAFIVGMFSIIKAEKENKEDIENMFKAIALSDDIRNALLGKDNCYHDILTFIINYEKSNADCVDKFLRNNNLNEEQIWNIYSSAVKYADFAFNKSIDPKVLKDIAPENI